MINNSNLRGWYFYFYTSNITLNARQIQAGVNRKTNYSIPLNKRIGFSETVYKWWLGQ